MKHRPNYKKIAKTLFLFAAAFLTGRFTAQAVDHFNIASANHFDAKSSGAADSEVVETSAEGNWGLSFQEDGKPPVANATAEELKQFDAYYAEQTEEKVLYLTFDAGYENGNTAPILDALKIHKAPATFFVVGTFIEENPDLIKRMT